MAKYYESEKSFILNDALEDAGWRSKQWINSDGQEIHLRCLTSKHLINIINMLNRQSEPGEDESDDWEPMDGDGYKNPLFYDLHREAALRGLMRMPNIKRWHS